MRHQARRHRPVTRLVAAAALVGLASAAVATEADRDAVQRQVEARLGLAGSELILLSIDPNPEPPLLIDVTLAGAAHTLELMPRSIRTDDFVVLEDRGPDGLVPIDVGPSRTMRGVCAGVPDSVVAAALVPDGVRAMIELPDVEGRFWIEPAPLAGPGVHVLYHDLDRLEPLGTCGVDADTPSGFVPAGGGAGDGATGGVAGTDECLYTAEVAIDADFPYFQAYGDSLSVVAQIESVIGTMNVQYERDVQITHEIGTIVVRLSDDEDPYSSTTSPSAVLGEFRLHWNSVLSSIPRDVAQLFTGKDLSGSVIGIAYLAGVCNSLQYSVVQDFGSFSCQTDLSAHEFGHNWAANHCSCPSNTMNSSLTCSNVFHPISTAPEMEAFRNSIAGCLDSACGLINDTCDTAIPVNAGSFPFSTENALTEGQPESSCPPGTGLQPFHGDVWYRYFSDCNGPVTVQTCDANFDTRLAVYESFCPAIAGQSIACDDDGCGTQSSLTFDAEDGKVYFIRVGGRDGAFGQGTLVIDDDGCLAPVPNDDCGNGATIGEGIHFFTTVNATTDGPTETACGLDGGDLEHDVWFRFQAPCDATATVRTCEADFDTRVAVYQGTCPNGDDAAIACDDDSCGAQSTVSFEVTAGTIYRIRVGGTAGATGDGLLELICGAPPCPADLDDNGVVDVDDLVAVILDWGSDGSMTGADLDNNGIVDVDDLVELLLAWGPCER